MIVRLPAPVLVLTTSLLFTVPGSAQDQVNRPINADMINSATLSELLGPPKGDGEADDERPDPAMVRLQVLLDRAAASPGVIDGYMGENVRKALRSFEQTHDLEPDGELDEQLISRLEIDAPVVDTYTITSEDVSAIVPPLPEDYSALAERDFLGFTSVQELLAERFHMDIDLLEALNPDSAFGEGDEVVVAQPGEDKTGSVSRIEADKSLAQLRAYDADGNLVVAYPATIGSEDNPSPSGTHEVVAIAPEPNYTYNPENFQQGDNDEVLILPPGPNNPVGTVWIDLSEPTYGIHGTPEPSLIDKTASHGCVRLTNWDAEELSKMVDEGVTVEFIS